LSFFSGRDLVLIYTGLGDAAEQFRAKELLSVKHDEDDDGRSLFLENIFISYSSILYTSFDICLYTYVQQSQTAKL